MRRGAVRSAAYLRDVAIEVDLRQESCAGLAGARIRLLHPCNRRGDIQTAVLGKSDQRVQLTAGESAIPVGVGPRSLSRRLFECGWHDGRRRFGAIQRAGAAGESRGYGDDRHYAHGMTFRLGP